MTEVLQILPWCVVLILIVRDGLLLWQAGRNHGVSQNPPATKTDVQIAPTHVAPPVVVSVAPAPQALETPVVDDGLIAFLKVQEGFTPKAKWDYKQYTNGYGTRAKSSDEVIDKVEAEKRLLIEAAHAEKMVEDFAPDAPKGVKQALTDLTFNLGTVWQHQGLGQLINAKDYAGAKERILQYNHAGGEVLEALTKRRASEAAMFDNPL